ncbi:MAG TPA: hypothetical protein VF817_04675 [Patescibacteria group bacterium]
MTKHLYSKIALTIYVLAAIVIAFWGYTVFKNRDGKVPTPKAEQSSSVQKNDTISSSSATDDLRNDSDADNTQQQANNQSTDANQNASNTANSSASTVSPVQNVSGKVLANITPEHCSSNCQAFANDLKLLEYCQQSCGISPIKNVSSCNDKSGIQKDYCTKDLAITKEDASICDKISDANIKQACKNRIAQDAIENQLNNHN